MLLGLRLCAMHLRMRGGEGWSGEEDEKRKERSEAEERRRRGAKERAKNERSDGEEERTSCWAWALTRLISASRSVLLWTTDSCCAISSCSRLRMRRNLSRCGESRYEGTGEEKVRV